MRRLILLIAILLSFVAQNGFAYTGKIWTNTADASSVDAGITYDNYGNWAVTFVSPFIGTNNSISNPGFETDTTGWATDSVTCGGYWLNSGATISRVISEYYGGVASGQVGTGTTAYQGSCYALSGTYASTSTYTTYIWIKSNTSTESVQLFLGSKDAAQGYCVASITLSSTWQQVSCNWTPSANSTNAIVGVRRASANSIIWFMDNTYVSLQSNLTGTYPINSPVVTFTALDLGYNATFDMSGFRATEILTIGSVKYQYRSHATDCTLGSWNGTWLTRTQMQQLSDISSIECIQFKAQFNSDGTQLARMDHLSIPYSPYKTVANNVIDTALNKLNPSFNYGATAGTVKVGYDTTSDDWGNYLIKLDTHLIPRETINSVTLNVYVGYITSKWEGSYSLRCYKVKDGNYYREGTKNALAAATGEPNWSYRMASTNAWIGSVGADTDGSDFDSWVTGDPEIVLGAGFSSGWQSLTIPLTWVRGWRDSGKNKGIICRTPERVNTHVLNIYTSEDSTNGAYFNINYSLDANEPTSARVIADDGHAYATYWTGVWHLVSDSQGSIITNYYDEERNLKLYKYDGHVWDRLTTVNSIDRAGSLLKDSGGTFHLIQHTASADSICNSTSAEKHYISIYPDDFTLLNSPLTIVGSYTSMYGSADIDSNDKIHAFVLQCDSSGTGELQTIKYYTKTLSGSWVDNGVLLAGHATDWMASRRPLYIGVWIEGTTIYVSYTRATNVQLTNSAGTQYEYPSSALIYSDDGGATWKKSDGTILTLPIEYWDDDTVTPTQNYVENNNFISSLTKLGNSVYVTHWINRPGGTLGANYVSNFTGTNNDYSFGGNTGIDRIGQTYTAASSAIGRACFKLKKTGSPIQKIYTFITTDDSTTGAGVRTYASNSPIIPSQITTAYQTFCQDFPEYTGDARITIGVLPRLSNPTAISNPGFEVDTTGWITTGPGYWLASGGTLTRDTVIFRTGVASGKVVSITTQYQGASFALSGTYKAGFQYTGSLWVKSDTSTESVQFFFGDNSDDSCRTSITLSTIWQQITCEWVPSIDILDAVIGIRKLSSSAMTWYVDDVTVDNPSGNYLISTDNVPSYSGGNFRYYNTIWNEDVNKDLNFELYLRGSSGSRTARVRKLTGGVWSDTTSQPTDAGNYNLLMQTLDSTLIDIVTHYDAALSKFTNLRYSESKDGGVTWGSVADITTDGGSNRSYFYQSRNRNIVARAPLIFSGTSGTPTQSLNDIYYVSLHIVNALSCIDCLGGELEWVQ